MVEALSVSAGRAGLGAAAYRMRFWTIDSELVGDENKVSSVELAVWFAVN